MSVGVQQNAVSPLWDAMLFDCDGVLVDSEPVVNQVLRDEVARLGWEMTLAECIDTFVGASLDGVKTRVQEHTGREVSHDWEQTFKQRRDDALRSQLQPVPGALELVALADKVFGSRVACASNSERSKIELQLEKAGLLSPFEGSVFSAVETGAAKPAPDVYLAAAESMEPPSASFLVLEDSPSGVQAGKAAGGYVIGLASTVSKVELQEAGADKVVTHLSEVIDLLVSCDGR